MTDPLTPIYARNMAILGHSDQGGRPDGVQVMVEDGYAYVGHIFSKGFSIVDVRDPRAPKAVAYVPAPPNTWTLHLQAADGLLLVIHNKDMFAQADMADEKAYYKGAVNQHAGGARDWSAGMAVYDLSTPGAPRQIGFMPVEGSGLHRIWYTGGRWAYASAMLDGFTDYILITIDMADPTRPRMAGRFWLPGMNAAAGEVPDWPLPQGRFGLHHPIVHGDVAYCSWRDACLAVVDVSNRSDPKLITRKVWSPPFGGGTHNALPLPGRDLLIVVDETVLDDGEDGFKPIWVFDNQIPSNPISIATFSAPDDTDYLKVGGHFGPHNIHENRPGTFQSEELIFATYQNAGVRVYDIRDPLRPEEVGACVPQPPARMVDPRPNRPAVLHSADVYVDRNGIVCCTDFNAGLTVMEYRG
ncbi:LVIVD repeat-containing protein [Ovoidimarina sediminis]|uniref:LVIVD repeat-containing protein n=1 Tax=Ovoidimarina sediminis TaxID=3079856 RepID=UPI0029080455|nr:hypothetical protein [Rhodophyticola sp. MJ-SS7]MDU8946417.1 hypothetical protein [Rhodophyticola sp. MJ-SS7]